MQLTPQKHVWISGTDTILTMKALCDYFECTSHAIYTWIKKEGFPDITKDGRTATFKLSEINQWIDNKIANPSTHCKIKARLTRLRALNAPPQTKPITAINELAKKLKPLIHKDDKLFILEQKISQLEYKLANIEPVIADQVVKKLLNDLNQEGL